MAPDDRLPGALPLIGRDPSAEANRAMLFRALAYWTGDAYGRPATGVVCKLRRNVCLEVAPVRFIRPPRRG